jgi:hypothetical protein
VDGRIYVGLTQRLVTDKGAGKQWKQKITPYKRNALKGDLIHKSFDQ